MFESPSFNNRASRTVRVLLIIIILTLLPSVAHAQFDFSISVSPDSATITQGGSANAIITVSLVTAPAETVTLSSEIAPPTTAVTVLITPTSGPPTFTANMQVSTTSATAASTYTITIAGTAGSLQRSTSFSLTVLANDYTLTLSPNSGAVLPGGSTMTSVTVDGGLQETVSLACPNIPSGISCNFLPASGTPTFTSSLTIGTISTLAPGSYTITVRGTSQTTSLVRQATYTLMVPGVMVNPRNINSVVTQFTVKVNVTGFTPFNGFDVRLLYRHQSAGGPLDATILTSVCPQNGISPGPPCVFPAGAQISTSVFRIDNPTAGEIRVVQSSTLPADAPAQGDLFTITFSVVGQGTSLLNITLEDFFLGIDTVPHVTRDGCYLPGDVSQDGVVNVSDLARVGASFLKSTGQPGFDASADINKDGTVNVLDLVIVGANFLKSC